MPDVLQRLNVREIDFGLLHRMRNAVNVDTGQNISTYHWSGFTGPLRLVLQFRRCLQSQKIRPYEGVMCLCPSVTWNQIINLWTVFLFNLLNLVGKHRFSDILFHDEDPGRALLTSKNHCTDCF